MTKSCLWRPELPSPNAWPLCSALCTKTCDGKFWEEQELKPVASWTSSSLFVPDLSAAGTPSLQSLGPKGSSCPCLSLCSSPTCCSDPFLDSLLCCSLVSPPPCPILCSPVDYSPPVFSVHGILQAGILPWVAIPFSRDSFQPRDQNCVSCTGRHILYHWATWEAPTSVYCLSFGFFLSAHGFCLPHLLSPLLPWQQMRLHVFGSEMFEEEIWWVPLVSALFKSHPQRGPCVRALCPGTSASL